MASRTARPALVLALLGLVPGLGATACSAAKGHNPIDAGTDVSFPPALAKGFPSGFLWGTATAPYQVEGNLHGDDWYKWEQLGMVTNNDSADNGPDEYDHYDEDFKAAADMGNNSVRIGIDMSRLFLTRADLMALKPEPGAVAHYHAVLASAKAHGLQPMVTLWHFATPLYLENPDKTVAGRPTGWLDPSIVPLFAGFCGWAGKEYGGEVDLWLTLNEPLVYLAAGYLAAATPPGENLQIGDAIAAAKNMIKGHAACYDALKVNDTLTATASDAGPALVSFAQHSRVFTPYDPTSANDVESTRLLHELENTFFLDAVTSGNEDLDFDGKITPGGPDVIGDPALKGRLDWIGLNYYGNTKVAYLNKKLFPAEGLPLQDDLNDGNPVSDFHWDIYPAGLRIVLDELQPYHLPIYITENGVADVGDVLKQRFLLDHLYVLQQAINDGYDIRGYYYWALIDNFEWNSGFCPHFGLLHYDPTTKVRTSSPGADVYHQVILQNAVTPAMFAAHPRYGAPTFCPPESAF